MKIVSKFYCSLLTLALTTSVYLSAQYSVPYSTSSVQGSTIITNYYDPNAGPNVGPGLPPSPLESRFNAPLSQPPPTRATTFPSTAVNFQAPVNTTYPQQYPQQYPQAQYAAQPTGPMILNPLPPGLDNLGIPSQPADPSYPYPGLLVFMNGKWEGSDYLYDIPQNIGIVVEVIKPGGQNVDVNTDELRNIIATKFASVNIIPQSLAIGNDPPLPFFHLLIFAYPGENNYTAAIAGRLFEKVRLARLNVALPGTFQAITWEKLDLIITSGVQFHEQLADSVTQIAKAFTDRVSYFNEQQVKQNSGFKLKPEVDYRSMFRGKEGMGGSDDCCCQ